MTKANEIAILHATIDALGSDSYLGPWLQSIAGEVEATIRSDYFPTITIAASVEEGNRIIARANAEAKTIIEQAQAEAGRRAARAKGYQDNVSEALRLALRNLNAV